MQETQGVPRFFIPAHPHASAAMHPIMRTFDDPAPGFAPGLLLERLGFCSPCADVGGAAKLGPAFPDRIIVIAFIPAHAVRCRGRRVGPRDGDTLAGGARPRAIIPLGAVDGEPEGYALALGAHAAFGARFPTSGGGLAPLFPPTRGFGHRPVHREPLPGNASQGVLVHEALCPPRHADVGVCPRLQAAMRRALRAAPRGVQGAPRASWAQHADDGLHRVAIINAGAMASQRLGCTRGEQGRDALPQRLRDTPVTVGVLMGVRPQCGS